MDVKESSERESFYTERFLFSILCYPRVYPTFRSLVHPIFIKVDVIEGEEFSKN